MLIGTQRQELSAALFAAFPSLDAFDLMLLAGVNQRRDRINTGVGVGLPAVIMDVIKASEDEFWTANLIAGAVSAVPANPELRAFLDKYPGLAPGAAAPAKVDHVKTHFLVGQRVFTARPDFRACLEKLGQGTNSRVIVVTGPRGSGKSYSQKFIGYLLQFDPAYRGATHKLRYLPLGPGVSSLESLAGELAMAFGPGAGPPPPRPVEDKEQDSRWMPSIFNWVAAAIDADPPVIWWLVLDEFRALPQSGFDLVDRLADHADTGTSRLRLILLNYPESRADRLPFSYREQIPKHTLDVAEVEAFIDYVYRLSGKTAGPDVVAATVKQILDQVAQEIAAKQVPEQLHLATLSLALTNAARKLLS